MNKTKQKLLLGALMFSSISFSLASNASDQIENNSNTNNQSFIDNDSLEKNIDPFKAKTSNLSAYESENKEAEAELKLLENQIAVRQKRFEMEMLPYQMKQQELSLKKGLYQEQNASREEPEMPKITEEDINKKIDDVAGNIIMKMQDQNDRLKKKIDTQEKAKNTFDLKMISKDSSGFVYAIISNSEGSHKVAQGSVVNGWKVINVDESSNRVIAKKGSKIENIVPASGDVVSKINYVSSSGANSIGTATSTGTGESMPNPDLPFPPNFP